MTNANMRIICLNIPIYRLIKHSTKIGEIKQAHSFYISIVNSS